MKGGIPSLGALAVQPNLPDHLKGRQGGAPFPEVGGRGALPVAPGGVAGEREDDPSTPLDDRVSISPEARQLLERERAGEQENESTEADGGAKQVLGEEELTAPEQRAVQKLRARDAEVRRHEQAHVAASGHLPTSGPTYTYETGPDGRRYAVGGEVGISIGEGKTPEETLRNAQAAQRAALAPADPSAQDQRVASRAAAMEQQARQEIQAERAAPDDAEEPPAAGSLDITA